MAAKINTGSRRRPDGPEDCNPLNNRIPAEVISRARKPEQKVVQEAPKSSVTVDLKEVLMMKPDNRGKWVSKAFQQAQDGRIPAKPLYDIVAHAKFPNELTDKVGKRIYRIVHANLTLFSPKQRRHLEQESMLAKQYAATAHLKDQFEKEEQQANTMEDMMARCRAFVREKQSERGERGQDEGPPPPIPDGEGPPPPPADETAGSGLASEVHALVAEALAEKAEAAAAKSRSRSRSKRRRKSRGKSSSSSSNKARKKAREEAKKDKARKGEEKSKAKSRDKSREKSREKSAKNEEKSRDKSARDEDKKAKASKKEAADAKAKRKRSRSKSGKSSRSRSQPRPDKKTAKKKRGKSSDSSRSNRKKPKRKRSESPAESDRGKKKRSSRKR